MVVTDTLEGCVDQNIWFHYDLLDDVLYLRFVDHLDSPALGDETSDGLTLLRDEGTGRIVGLTVVSWWKRFGDNGTPGSLPDFERQIHLMTKTLVNLAGIEPRIAEAVVN